MCAGGPAGLIAVVSAVGNCTRTLLIERYNFIGGMAPSALVTPTSEFRHFGKHHIAGIPLDLLTRTADMGCANVSLERGNYQVNYAMLKLAVQRMLLLKSCVTLLYHSWFSDCVMGGGRDAHVVLQNKAGRVAHAGHDASWPSYA